MVLLLLSGLLALDKHPVSRGKMANVPTIQEKFCVDKDKNVMSFMLDHFSTR
jgi:hypothetical protein